MVVMYWLVYMTMVVAGGSNPKLSFAVPGSSLSSTFVDEPDVANYIKNRFLDAD